MTNLNVFPALELLAVAPSRSSGFSCSLLPVLIFQKCRLIWSVNMVISRIV
jgi:hypothetical protein